MFKPLALALALALPAALPAQSDAHGKSFDHQVKFETGEKQFLDGDAIFIDTVTGTADTVRPGNLYQVKGHYKLSTQPSAVLALNVTTSSRDATPNPILQLQDINVDKGEGAFTVYFYLAGPGWPHLSFYPTHGGQSFSTVYFGNGPSLHRTANEGPHD